MSEFKFDCPLCQEPIQCGVEYAGYPIQCPACNGQITVPKPEARPKVRVTTTGRSTPPMPVIPPLQDRSGSKSPYLKIGVYLLLIGIILAALFPVLKRFQKKTDAAIEEAAESGGGGQEATDPARSEPKGEGVANPPGTSSETPVETPAPVAAELSAPIIAPVWTLDLEKAEVPGSRANGTLGGTNFVVNQARLHKNGILNILSLRPGTNALSDRELLVYIRLKPGESMEGKTIQITRDLPAGVPQVAKKWRPDPRYAPQQKFFSSGYLMKLEFGKMKENSLPGKIYLALPDSDGTVLAGHFEAETGLTAASATDPAAAAAPAAAPQQTMDPKMRARYGLK